MRLTATVERGAPRPQVQPRLTARLGRADVWQLQIPAWSPGLCQAADVLDAEERARARRHVREVDRRRFLLAHTVLRRLLGTYLRIAPRDVALSRAPCPNCGGPHGRPQVLDTEAPLHFSMSRAADVALIAIAAVPVGIDVEAVAPSLKGDDLAQALHPAERFAIDSMPPNSRATAALRCWVRKEAYLKGLGTGLGLDPTTIHVGCGSAKPVEEPLAGDGPGAWSLIDLPAGAGHMAAVALAPAPHAAPVRLSS